ncbi:MAG: hypothetical protein VX738_08620 [Planctomycetota bacterium]|nr:hypothetical protein [Planctomycetota bacterium]
MRLFWLSTVIIILSIHGGTVVGQEDPSKVFSGPQPGEPLAAFDVQYAFGEEAGKTMDPLKAAGEKPILLIFVHQLTRPVIGLTRALTQFSEQHQDALYTNMIFLTDDVTAMRQRLTRARQALPSKTSVTIAPQGIEGPGAYGLNRNVTLTIVFGKSQSVVSNTALIEPSVQADAVKILTPIAKTLNLKVPKLMELSVRTAAAGEVNVRELLGPVINKSATVEQVDLAAKKMESEFAKKREVAVRIGVFARRIIDADRLENYGTPRAQYYLSKWAKMYGKPKQQ